MSDEEEQRGDGADDDEIFGIERRKALIAVGLAVLLAVGAFGLIGQVANYGELLKAVRRSSKVWFPLAALGEVIAYVGYILAYRDLARTDGGPRLRFWTVTRIVGLGFGAFVVGSSAGGLAVDFWALKRAGQHVHEAARRVLALNTLEWAILAWFATLAAAIGGVALVRHMFAHPTRHVAGLAGFPVYWLGDLITLYAGVRAFGAHISPSALVLAYTSAYVLTMLPLPAGGAGSMDAVIAFTLHTVGVPLAPALLASFLYRIFAFWLPIVPALLLLPQVPRLNEELGEVAEAT